MKFLLLTILSFSLTASLPTDLVHKRVSNSTITTTTTTTTTITTTLKPEPCINHVCQREGLFPEGPCDESFCQCQCVGNHCSGVRQQCFEGTFFHAVIHVCDFPWNIPACTEQDTDEGLPADSVPKSVSNPTTNPNLTTTTTMHSTSTTTTTTTSTTTTTPKQEPCINHVCQREGLFPEGPCDESFCQCQCVGNHCSGVRQQCFEGTFFHAVIHVCDFPWNIPACAEQQSPNIL